jgi:hypothetical protein
MHAQVGDWLVVNSHADGRPTRPGEIVAAAADGRPPYTVRWTDSDHEAVVFPGPDAVVLSAAERAERAKREAERIVRLQSAIRGGPAGG